jgi:hypothetical protein
MKQRIWIAADWIDDPMIRALTEHHNPEAVIFPRKRPRGTSRILQQLENASAMTSTHNTAGGRNDERG